MSSHCTVCQDYETCKQVNRLLIERVSVRKIAERFPDLGYRSVQRHKVRCCAKRLFDAWKRRDILLQVDTESLLTDLLGLKARLQNALVEADAKEDPSGYASIAREARQCVESFFTLERLAAEHGGAGPREVKITVVYGEEKAVDLPQPDPRVTIVRKEPVIEATPRPSLPFKPEPEPPAVEPEIFRPARCTPPLQPAPRTAAVVAHPEPDERSEDWNRWLRGDKKI
jgi:hypothetical protein